MTVKKDFRARIQAKPGAKNRDAAGVCLDEVHQHIERLRLACGVSGHC